MNSPENERLPALLNPRVQQATRWVATSAIAALCLAAWWSARGDTSSLQQHPERAELQLDLNRAGERELTLMPGIGAKTAGQIIANRQQHGAFTSLEDLARVPGVGPKTIEALAPYCFVEQ
ncbi:helix-hairpin-helix domain-containing protein [Stieleria sp. TO1_6]|uniref:ComEA family DNA-binding protein n=1 Tax=Stieleria tagensis TaxID=2956795 RepID=UPI00209B3616|nr:helix-hairpin-helix domain-containing protein [Stieleria tagensis]MCO8120858.1 helix-hairpin-helix domain-containing protein [Stieleria tagensis]